MEAGQRLLDVLGFIGSKVPSYRYTVFQWVKPYEGFGEIESPPADCVRMSSISEYKKERLGDWGNIFFYTPSSAMCAEATDL